MSINQQVGSAVKSVSIIATIAGITSKDNKKDSDHKKKPRERLFLILRLDTASCFA
jgi:hypothetical protein